MCRRLIEVVLILFISGWTMQKKWARLLFHLVKCLLALLHEIIKVSA